jgi:hypothetical protein
MHRPRTRPSAACLSCPTCRGPAEFVGYRPRSVLSLLGPLRLRRAYDHCPGCRAGSAPADAELRLSGEALTPAAREAVCLAGVLSRFAEAAGVTPPKLAGLRPGESTVERATEAAGRNLGDRLAAGETLGAARDWAWHKDAEGKTCAYVAVDATGVGRQGPVGMAAEGRMATVAMVSNPVPDARGRPDGPPRLQVRSRSTASRRSPSSTATRTTSGRSPGPAALSITSMDPPTSWERMSLGPLSLWPASPMVPRRP